MKDISYLLLHLLTTIAKLIRPGGGRAVIAENLLLKQQLIVHNRSRQRAPNLTTQDRTLLSFRSLFLNPRRLARSAILIKPSTLLHFHNALKKRKYRLLFSPRGVRKPGPKGPGNTSIRQVPLEVASQHSGQKVRYRHTEGDRDKHCNKFKFVHALTIAAGRMFATY